MRSLRRLTSRGRGAKQSPWRFGDTCTCAKRRCCFVSTLWLLAMTGLLVACLPLNSTQPTATPIPTATQTSPQTPTIVWFPASATPTHLAFPTYTAMPEMSPGIGSVTFSDDFTDDSVWDTGVSNRGSAAISRKRLTLAAAPGAYLESLRRELTLDNFYAEITARPSLCRRGDSYGILVRGIGLNYYRFILSCNSQVSSERVNAGVKLSLQEAIPSGDAPRGAPGEVRIGVWAVGGDIRLFLNGRYQFGINDKSFPSGAIGVFVRSADNPMSVTFSDLTVYEVDYVPPTRTPMP